MRKIQGLLDSHCNSKSI